ncbi:exodeoxyribonuclease III [Corynebacterium sp. ES2794-CONJ1]|uniref:exodeoxyribonuclease III n=1 Tax=unclassified Corynebacterium TaxID=2624378 RepID=UPI002169DDC7|nr:MULTISPECIES: exodeoxyribonuclease III [unclassified Corynebacterium]MCS4490221.1 exodeoxyribonuclease III [Corynebacterium sp. ES2775-CONJ]MCS4532072.1 exodeoxyribonuclease III [Corynebacterium sp. ES2730-CONJ]MCU9519474.1 exodeoxyribonuclease III [Corynebacterium sp. ES2794-CONJ1]
MRVANWNINSVRTRTERARQFLDRHDIDICLLQETKCTDEQFPYDAFPDYEIAHCGFGQWNGVAILSRVGLDDIQYHFPHQPGFAKDPLAAQEVEARAIGATCQGVEVWSLYTPHGRSIADAHYDYKLRWLFGLRNYVDTTSGPLILGGDFNVIPRDENVWSVAAFAGKTHITEPERQAFFALIDAGLEIASPQTGYSNFDYKDFRFERNEGLLIDFQLSRDLTIGDSFIDLDERRGKGASDHTPVVVDYR